MAKLKISLAVLAIAALGLVWIFVPRHDVEAPATAVDAAADATIGSHAVSEGSPVPGPTSADDSESLSVAAKREQARQNAIDRTGLSEEEIRESGRLAIAAFYDPATSNQFLADIHMALTETYGEEEADFLSGLMVMSDWESVKASIDARRTETGQNYDEIYTRLGLAHGDISVDELTRLSATGPGLPQDAIHQLAKAGRVDAIGELANNGVLADVNYRDPVTGQNAVSVLIQNIGYYPNEYDPESAASALRQLIELGVETRPQDGSFDALDYALQVNAVNGHLKIAMAEVLIEQGAQVEESHLESLAGMREGPVKQEFLELLGAAL